MLSRTEAFFDFINEREEVRQRRLAGFSFPWTDDLILRSYKFTNVFREFDKVSSELIKHFYGPNKDAPREEILMNAALARYFGTYEFVLLVGWQKFDTFDFEGIKKLAAERLAQKERVFTGAYVITNQGISAPKEQVVVDVFLKGLYERAALICRSVNHNRSWEQAAKIMSVIPGFGGTGFMTKEVLLDTTYTSFWDDGKSEPFSFPTDWNSWTPIGPGARRGAARVMGDDDAKPLVEKKALYVILDLFLDQKVFWKHDRELCLTDVQFQLCEFDKYERVRLGQGKPRSRYHAP